MPIFSLCICFAGHMTPAMQNDGAVDYERATNVISARSARPMVAIHRLTRGLRNAKRAAASPLCGLVVSSREHLHALHLHIEHSHPCEPGRGLRSLAR